jgi:tetratricopeptide (TPR) repeat protein
MNEPELFQFTLSRPPEGGVVELSSAEFEKLLLKRLEEEKNNPIDALWQLARFYQQAKQGEKALDYLRKVLQRQPDVESKATSVLAMGQTMEAIGDYPAAVRFYKEAFALEPVHTTTWYFINNNLGFSLNTLGDFTEGEKYCRKALEIDPIRPNAHKNLGIALTGHGQYREAAECFVNATRVNAADARALGLLKNLVRDHPELQFEFEPQIARCDKAVEAVAEKAEEMKPVVHRGWKKQLFLLRLGLRQLTQRFSFKRRKSE